MNKVCHWIESFAKYTLIILIGVLLGVLSIVSLFYTTYITNNEHAIYKMDNPFILIGLLIVFIALLFLYDRTYKLKKINTKKIFIALMAYTVIVGLSAIFLARGIPVADPGKISAIANAFLHNNFSSLQKGGYLYSYPYQLGVVSLLGLIYWIFGKDQYVIFEVVNLVAVLLSYYFLYKITDESFKNKKINNLLILFLFGCFPCVMFVIFVYGNLISLCLILAAIWAELKYFKNGRLKYFLVAALSISLAVLMKSNSLIVVVAMVIMIILNALKERKPSRLILAICLILAVLVAGIALDKAVEGYTGVTVNNKGVPSVVFVAMGMQEGPRAPGWANGYTSFYASSPYIKNGYNSEKTTVVAELSISKSVSRFVKDPGYALGFFGQKLSSEWNDPSYQSIWIGSGMKRSGELSKIGESLYVNENGKVRNLALGFMNFYQSLIIICAFAFILLSWKTIKYYQLFLAVVVIGGFLFHTIWEAKGQYIMPYFVMLVPFAAAGAVHMLEYINKKIEYKNVKIK